MALVPNFLGIMMRTKVLLKGLVQSMNYRSIVELDEDNEINMPLGQDGAGQGQQLMLVVWSMSKKIYIQNNNQYASCPFLLYHVK